MPLHQFQDNIKQPDTYWWTSKQKVFEETRAWFSLGIM